MKLSRSLIVLPVLAVLAALAGCGGSSTSTSSTPPATSTAGPSCEGVHLGQTGVIALKCDGTATVKAVTGGVSRTITGGVCTTGAGLFVVNAGVVTDHTFVGTRPDFLSVNTPIGGGGGPDTAASILLDGKFYGDSGRFGGTAVFTADHKGLTFNGMAGDGETATIVVSGC